MSKITAHNLWLLAIFALTGLSPVAQAGEWLSINQPTPLYEAPSQQSKPRFLLQTLTPVESLVVLGDQAKVRVPGGKVGWVSKQHLTARRTVLINVDKADIRSQPDARAPVVFEAERNVVLDLLGPSTSGWWQVRHRDGQWGFINAGQIWGQ